MKQAYDLHSGFRDAFSRTIGEPPGGCRNAGAVFLAGLRSPLGTLVAGATSDGICLLEYSDRRMLETELVSLKKFFSAPILPGVNQHLEQLQVELGDYFAGTARAFSVPLVVPGTAFQRRVWQHLLAIPYGQTRSYEQVAGAIGAPKAARAVGHANGLNRIAIVIPCHRLLNKSGRLGGYGGGLRRKQFLLDLERGRPAG